MMNFFLRFFKRGKVQKMLAICGYYLGINAIFYWLNRNAKRIITFHNVLPSFLFRDDGTNGVSCSDIDFRKIVSEVAKRYRFSTDIGDSRTATITFDDGYLNQYEVAAKILHEMGEIPAIIFVAGDLVNADNPYQALVIDKLLFWKSYVPIEILHDCFKKEASRSDYWKWFIRPLYAQDQMSHGNSALRRLNAIYDIGKIFDKLPFELKRLRLTGIPSLKLQELSNRGWIVAWHSKSHYPLALIKKDKVKEELAPQEGFDKSVFSFPYGEMASVSKENIAEVQQLGYRCAVSNICAEHDYHSRWFLPRLMLSPDKVRLHFELSGFKYFTQHLRLMPSPEICEVTNGNI